MTLRYLRPASRELSGAARYYEEQKEGLGAEFLVSVDKALEYLFQNPMLGPVVYRSYREIQVRRFPFSVIYSIEPDHILVVAVMHHSRNPGYWHDRV